MIKLSQLLKEWSAQEVINQLGGNRFIAMTGAKKFVYDNSKKWVQFYIGKNHRHINVVRITLNGKDLYDMEFIRTQGDKKPAKVVAKHNDIYNDMLAPIFKKETGMNLSL